MSHSTAGSRIEGRAPTAACVAKTSRSCRWPGHGKTFVGFATVGQRNRSSASTNRPRINAATRLAAAALWITPIGSRRRRGRIARRSVARLCSRFGGSSGHRPYFRLARIRQSAPALSLVVHFDHLVERRASSVERRASSVERRASSVQRSAAQRLSSDANEKTHACRGRLSRLIGPWVSQPLLAGARVPMFEPIRRWSPSAPTIRRGRGRLRPRLENTSAAALRRGRRG